MLEPITLASVGGAVLTEGIKFLYGQAAEAIKVWRQRKESGHSVSELVPATQTPPAIFKGELAPLQYHLENVEALKDNLAKLTAALANHATGISEIEKARTASDEEALLALEGLRQVMEAIFQQRLTFEGEDRPSSGPVLDGKISVKTVEGKVAAVMARSIAGGRIRGDATADTVKPGGEFYGIKADKVVR